MTLPSDATETSKQKGSASTFRKRLLIAFLVCSIQAIYIPTSNQVAGGIEPRLPIDIFPIWPIWVLPYVLCYALWPIAIVWLALKMEDRLFRAFLVACVLTLGIGTSTFIFFPTYIKAATIAGSDIFASLLRFIHENWGRYDAFPSGHVYITTLLALFLNRLYPRLKVGWISSIAIVALSTLFTGQHYIIDAIGGYIIALAGYHFGLWWAGFYPAPKQTDQRSGRRITSSSFD